MTDQATTTPTGQPCRILALDGSGAKEFYPLGVLKQLEALTGPLHERFDLIFETSTGAIIAALLALGKPVSEFRELYRKHVPRVMRPLARRSKSAALKRLAERTQQRSDPT